MRNLCLKYHPNDCPQAKAQWLIWEAGFASYGTQSCHLIKASKRHFNNRDVYLNDTVFDELLLPISKWHSPPRYPDRGEWNWVVPIGKISPLFGSNHVGHSNLSFESNRTDGTYVSKMSVQSHKLASVVLNYRRHSGEMCWLGTDIKAGYIVVLYLVHKVLNSRIVCT